MKTGAVVGIAVGAGIPAILILIGLIGFLIKFFMKRFRRRPWDEITSLPKDSDSVNTASRARKTKRPTANDRDPLFPPSDSNSLELPGAHIAIPIDEIDLPPSQREMDRTRQHQHTLVQIQRERLDRLKEEGTRLRPMLISSDEESQLQRAIDQAQKEFDQSV